jgi:hypothetical protein
MLVFPDCCTVILGAPRHVTGTPTLVAGAPRFVAGALRFVAGAPRFVAGTLRCVAGAPRHSKVLPGFSSELPVTLKAGKNALLWSDTLLKLTHLSLHSTSSQTLLDAFSDQNTFR